MTPNESGGEGGEDEAILPLSDLSRMMNDAYDAGASGGGGGNVTNVYMTVQGSVMAEHELVDAVINGVRRAISVNGEVFAVGG